MQRKYKRAFRVENSPLMKCLVKPLGVYLKNNPCNLANQKEKAFDPIHPYYQHKEQRNINKIIMTNTFQRSWATGQKFY